jgi:hypothetical protein
MTIDQVIAGTALSPALVRSSTVGSGGSFGTHLSRAFGFSELGMMGLARPIAQAAPQPHEALNHMVDSKRGDLLEASVEQWSSPPDRGTKASTSEPSKAKLPTARLLAACACKLLQAAEIPCGGRPQNQPRDGRLVRGAASRAPSHLPTAHRQDAPKRPPITTVEVQGGFIIAVDEPLESDSEALLLANRLRAVARSHFAVRNIDIETIVISFRGGR